MCNAIIFAPKRYTQNEFIITMRIYVIFTYPTDVSAKYQSRFFIVLFSLFKLDRNCCSQESIEKQIKSRL